MVTLHEQVQHLLTQNEIDLEVNTTPQTPATNTQKRNNIHLHQYCPHEKIKCTNTRTMKRSQEPRRTIVLLEHSNQCYTI